MRVRELNPEDLASFLRTRVQGNTAALGLNDPDSLRLAVDSGNSSRNLAGTGEVDVHAGPPANPVAARRSSVEEGVSSTVVSGSNSNGTLDRESRSPSDQYPERPDPVGQAGLSVPPSESSRPPSAAKLEIEPGQDFSPDSSDGTPPNVFTVAASSGAAFSALGGGRDSVAREYPAPRVESQKDVEERTIIQRQRADMENGDQVVYLAPELVGLSEYANRVEVHYETKEFKALYGEIASAGQNVQPIKVRKLAQPRPDGVAYEIVYGHRRHRACLLLKVEVAAIIADVDDETLVVEMSRENRNRADLSAYEMGEMCLRALDRKLFPSVRQMAERLGVDWSNMSKAIQLASLPPEVLSAFSSVLSLQHRWGPVLQDAVAKDRSGVLQRAAQIAATVPRLTDKAVFELLTARDADATAAVPVDLMAGGKAVGSWSRNTRGGLTIKVKAGVLTVAQEKRLREAMQKALNATAIA